MVSRLLWTAVLSNTLSLLPEIVDHDHSEVLKNLFIQVLILLNCLSKVESRSTVQFQIKMKTVLLVILSVCQVCEVFS